MIKENLKYDGKQLAPHWIYRNFSLLGDAIVAFIGETDVPIDNMVDLVDQVKNDYIYSPLMLNFIIEHFNTYLELAIYRQRLLMCIIKEVIEIKDIKVDRNGDDLFIGDGKLSVSIATRSLISTLIHVGVNIETEGTPVKTAGLKAIGIDSVEAFANEVMDKYIKELQAIDIARCKVRGIAFEG